MGKRRGERDDQAYLTHLGSVGRAADPELPLEASPNDALLVPAPDGHTRAIDFDAIELMNGDSREQYLQVRELWYAFLRQGLRRTATANSDTHGPDEIAAYPRNYVYVGEPGAAWDEAGFDAAIREGRLFGTNGPLIAEFTANGARMGDDVAAPGGRVVVELAIAAAPWVPVDEVRLLANGEVVRSWRELPGGASPPTLRLRERVELDARARRLPHRRGGRAARRRCRRLGGDATRETTRSVVAPGFVPAAFTNPIWVDADGDGRFAAPGLPPRTAARGPGARCALPLALAVIVISCAAARSLSALGPRRRRRRSLRVGRLASPSSSAMPTRWPAVKPPSTTSAWPLTNEASSEARKSAAAATSSGWPARPSWCASTKRSRKRSKPGWKTPAVIEVSISPGHRQFTRMPRRP